MNALLPFEGWLLSRSPHGLVLRRPATGVELNLEDDTAAACVQVLTRARRGATRPQLEAAAAARLGREARALVAALLEHRVLRSSAPARRAAAAQVVMMSSHGRVWATLAKATPCRDCLRLRLAARPSQAALAAPLLPPLRAELALALAEAPLRPGEVLRVGEALPVARLALLEHPDCRRCAEPRTARAIAQALRAPPRRAEPAAHRALRDPELGPLELHRVDPPRGQYPMNQPFAWGSVHLHRELQGAAFSSSTLGGLYSSGPRCALLATSEGVERLAVRGARPDVWARASAERRAVPLHQLYSWAKAADARRVRPFNHALSLHDGTPRLVPFESVAVGVPARALPHALHRQPFYTGAASHLTLPRAVLHATVELLVRDAFMISWYRRRALAELAWPRAPSATVRGRARYLERAGLRVELFHLTLDVPLPLVLLRLTATRRRGHWPKGGALLVPAGGFDPMAALEHALGLSCAQYLSLALQPAPFKNPLDPAAVRALGKQLQFWPALARYLDPRNRHAHDFLGAGRPVRQPFESLSRAAATVASTGEKLRAAGLDWLAVRLTDAPARRSGFETVKVIIPGLLDAARSREEMDLRSPRLHRDWPLARAGVHTFPHPLY
ncbi:MAG: YcaO-like family protein [Archangiaceae bacterium]|nr:YcaO-like family protein [Archangiaceae bacterium]